FGRRPAPPAGRPAPVPRQRPEGGPISRPRPAATGRKANQRAGTVLRAGSRALRSKLAAAGLAAGVAAGAFGLAAAQAGPNRPGSHAAAHQAGHGNGGRAGALPAGRNGRAAAGFPAAAGSSIGILGAYWVGQDELTLTEPAHSGPSGQPVGQRTLLTLVRYPAAGH